MALVRASTAAFHISGPLVEFVVCEDEVCDLPQQNNNFLIYP